MGNGCRHIVVESCLIIIDIEGCGSLTGRVIRFPVCLDTFIMTTFDFLPGGDFENVYDCKLLIQVTGIGPGNGVFFSFT